MTSDRKTAIVTGGNSGIGFVTARELVRLGWRVVLTGRNPAKLEAAVRQLASTGPGEASHRVADFASFADVRRLAAQLSEEPRIDVLLNNIGIALTRKETTRDGHDLVLQVNHLSPFLLTNLLRGKLEASAPSRIVTLSSALHMGARSHNFDDFEFQRSYSWSRSYAVTKLYNVMFTREMAARLRGTGVTANALHPGAIQTALGADGEVGGLTGLLFPIVKARAFRPLDEGARVPLFVATAPELATTTGAYFSTGLRAEEPSLLASDPAAARKLWEMSTDATGIGA